ncbi:MAG TPA: hypothetical protein VFD00_00650 [Thermoclostridium sp.]|nr:hypothetical protein [Thermoclostridium sp.]
MWGKIKSAIKRWWFAVITFIAGLVLLAKKPSWTNDKEIEDAKSEVEDHQKQVIEAKEETKSYWELYKEVEAEYETKLQEIRKEKIDDPVPFENPDDAADYIDDLITDLRR